MLAVTALLCAAAVVATGASSASAAASARPPAATSVASASATEDLSMLADPPWRWPVPPPLVVVEPFRAPATAYSAGHRGVDLAATPGAVVVAPASGVVHFAGMVAGRPVVSLDHGEGVLSAVEPVVAGVAEGDRVAAGDVIGAVGTGGHCDPGCVHFGVRVDGEYVSPFLFLGGVPRSVLLPLS